MSIFEIVVTTIVILSLLILILYRVHKLEKLINEGIHINIVDNREVIDVERY